MRPDWLTREIQACVDREIDAGVEWMRKHDQETLMGLRVLIGLPDSAEMLRRLGPEQATVVARLAVIGFDQVFLRGWERTPDPEDN